MSHSDCDCTLRKQCPAGKRVRGERERERCSEIWRGKERGRVGGRERDGVREGERVRARKGDVERGSKGEWEG